MLSIIIPHRSDEYLNETIEDLISKAGGDIEIIVVCDGVWPSKIFDNKLVRYVHYGTKHNNKGMRTAINSGVALAKGKYIMKIDEHCMLDKAYDLKLAADCDDNWVVIPRRKRLDPDKWAIIKDGRPDIDYNYITYPYEIIGDSICGLHGKEWRRPERADILIDDTCSMQGSCWFMPKKHWETVIVEMDNETFGPFTLEAQEIAFKSLFSGGECKVNKKTWYAHMHKGKRGKNYQFSNDQYKVFMAEKERGRVNGIDFWVNNRWDKRIYDWEWLINVKFPGMPGWGPNWKDDLIRDKKLEDEYKLKPK